MEDILFDLYYKQAHRNEELEQTIEELEQTNVRLSHKIEKQNQKIDDMQKEIERLHKVFDIKDDARCELVKENKELQRIINDLQSDLEGATNDYKQAVNEVKLLNKQFDKLIAENNDLKHRSKILVKHLLNIMYGFDYADNVSIKETKNNDDNN